MPPLAAGLSSALSKAAEIAAMCERLRANARIGNMVRPELTAARTQLVYELAYLRIFNAWEVFLEEVFLRYLCGYRFQSQTESPLSGFAYTLQEARTRLYGGSSYLLWHNPDKAISRANQHFRANNRLALVLGSSRADVMNYASIRHRIAHDHDDAIRKFNAASLQLAARRFRGSRPGALLRYPTTYGNLPCTWLERIALELSALAGQLAP